MKRQCIDCESEFDDREQAFRVRCFACWKTYKEETVNPFARAKTLPPMLPKEWHEFLNELPALLQLCHPDKHNQSLGSQRLTDWLIKVKKRHGGRRSNNAPKV